MLTQLFLLFPLVVKGSYSRFVYLLLIFVYFLDTVELFLVPIMYELWNESLNIDVNNSINIQKTNNHLSPWPTEHKQRQRHIWRGKSRSWLVCLFVCLFVCFMVFNATFNNISVISWRSVLLVEDIREHGENHRPVASHLQTFSHVIHLALIENRTHNISGDRH